MAKDLEARVAVLESVAARRLFGGTEEEAMKKWQEEFFPSNSAPAPTQGPKQAVEPKAEPEHAHHGKGKWK